MLYGVDPEDTASADSDHTAPVATTPLAKRETHALRKSDRQGQRGPPPPTNSGTAVRRTPATNRAPRERRPQSSQARGDRDCQRVDNRSGPEPGRGHIGHIGHIGHFGHPACSSMLFRSVAVPWEAGSLATWRTDAANGVRWRPGLRRRRGDRFTVLSRRRPRQVPSLKVGQGKSDARALHGGYRDAEQRHARRAHARPPDSALANNPPIATSTNVG